MLSWIGKNVMQMLARVFPGKSLQDDTAVVWGGGTPTDADEVVTEERAMTLSAVFACVELYGAAHTAMPVGVLRQGGSKREYATENPAHKLIHLRPNKTMNAGTYWKLVERHRLLWGVSYSEIEWNGRSEPKAIWPIEPWRVRPIQNENKDIVYEVDGLRTVYADDMLVFPHVTFNGIDFKSAVVYGAECMGGALGAVKTGNRWFASGGMPQLFFKHPGRMDKPARDIFRQEYRENARTNRDNIAILFENMDVISPQMEPQAMQLLETKQFSQIDICRFFAVPPHKIRVLTDSSYNTNEQGEIDWVRGSVVPVIVDKEQELNTKLVKHPDYYCKFAVEGMLRGDTAARGLWYEKMRGIGVYSTNDICDKEDMDRVPGGDVRVVNAAYVPMHLIEEYWESKIKAADKMSEPALHPNADPNADPANQEGTNPAPDPEKQPPVTQPPAKKPGKLSDDPFFRSALERMQRREAKALRRAAKHPDRFLAWMLDFLPKQAAILREVLEEPIRVHGGERSVDEIVAEHVAALEAGILKAAEVPKGQFADSIEDLIDSWNLDED